MDSKKQERLHYLMSFNGGFLGVYAILNFCDLFGSAQTANMIYLVTDILGHNLAEFVLRAGGLLLYMCAVALAVWLPRHSTVNLRLLSICFDGLAALVLGFLPKGISPVLGLYPLFFAMAFQWSCFSGATGFNSSTIFSTNNLKQFTMASAELVLNRNKSHLPKAKFYGKTLLSFHSGVAVSYLLWLSFGLHTSWLCLLPLAAAFALELSACRESNESPAL